MYIYETHCHTSEASKCSRIKASDLVDFYKSEGYSGLIVTDHFLNGNTTVPRDMGLSWEEKINLYCKGYENAKQRGDEIGFDVFFGWECSYGGNDLLTYGLDKEWLLSHPDCDKMEPYDYCDLVHESGGYIVHAHPFRDSDYIKTIKLWPKKIDAVEIINASRPDKENDMALVFANLYGIPHFCGSDNHSGRVRRISQLGFEEEMKSPADIMQAVIAGKQFVGAKFLY